MVPERRVSPKATLYEYRFWCHPGIGVVIHNHMRLLPLRMLQETPD